MRILKLWLFLLLFVPLAMAQAPSSKEAMKTEERPQAIPGFDINALDKSANPCDDFYQYACGTWMKNNPIPSDQASWGRFNELAERNRLILRQILEEASANDPHRDAVHQKIGDYYASCMDEKGVEAKGIEPLKPYLDRIAALRSKPALVEEIAALHRESVNVFFRFESEQDFKDSTQQIAAVDQGGLGLPDRDYYLKDDAKSLQLRQQYVAHVQKMFELLGDKPDTAAAEAKTVMEIETALAKASMERVKRREPANLYHKVSSKDLAEMAPAFDWTKYFRETGAPPLASLNVRVPEFFKEFQAVLASQPLDNLKTYLRWHVAHGAAPFLTAAFVNQNFDFYGKALTGQKEIRPRWKRCVAFTDDLLGEALGQSYVEKTFGAAGKQRTLKMVDALERALQDDIEQLPWMTADTKKQALVKLEAIRNKIGYPDKWRDYAQLRIVRGDLLGDSARGEEFEFHRQIAKIGQPVDPAEWLMSPPTVNAYYDPQMNNINFPAGILQPPFFDRSMDDAVNFGAIGVVIGHELTHGFDDEGRQFDAQGNLRDWWTPQDAKAFQERASCIADEYSEFQPVPGVQVNGRLTLGENAADNGGARIAYMALMDSLAGKSLPKIDGFTPEQRFFLGYAQIWCQNRTEQIARMLATVDPHSPGRFRTNGVVQNMPEFQKAFACHAGQPMVRAKACRVW